MTLCTARLHTAGAVSRMTDYLDSRRSALRSARRCARLLASGLRVLGPNDLDRPPTHPDKHRPERPCSAVTEQEGRSDLTLDVDLVAGMDGAPLVRFGNLHV
jgi:hypothetical protein